MSLSGKVLIVCILVASLSFVYLSARTVHTAGQWGKLATDRQARIDQLTKDQIKLGDQKKETQDLIYRSLIGWDRVWDNVAVTDVDPDDGTVTITGDREQLAGLLPERIGELQQGEPPEPRLVHAFAFNEAAEGTYLGEFLVDSVEVDEAANVSSAILEPVARVDLEQLQQFQGQQTPWRLRASIPTKLKAQIRNRAAEISLRQDQANRRASLAEMWLQAAEGYERQRDLRFETVAALETKKDTTEAELAEAHAEKVRLTQELASATTVRDDLIEQNKKLSSEIGRLESFLINEPAQTASFSLR